MHYSDEESLQLLSLIHPEANTADIRHITNLLQNRADPNFEIKNRQRPKLLLNQAARADRPDIIHLLMEHGADINKYDYHMETPLHEAASMGNIAALKTLLDYGPDPYIGVHNEETPLDSAEYYLAAAHASVDSGEEFDMEDIIELANIVSILVAYEELYNEELYTMSKNMQRRRRATVKGRQTRKKGQKKAAQTRTLLQGSRKKPYQNIAQTVLGDLDLGSKIISKHWGAKTTAGGRKKK